jgi:hypothetical protein
MKRFLLLIAIVLCIGASTETFAQGYGIRRANNRADRLRIQRGIRSGQLTRQETWALRERQRQLRLERRGYRSDGTLTRDERREIRRDARQQDRLIRRYRRNDDRSSYDGRGYQRRGNGYYRRGAGSWTHPVFGSRNRY